MNDETIADLKQFMSATISQQLALQTEGIDKKFENVDIKFKNLERRLGQGIDDIDTKLDTIANTIGNQMGDDRQIVEDHETRITKLEHKAA